MRTSSVVAASAALVAGANAWGNVTYTTEVVTAYTTFCPSSTELVHGTKTYTVTEVNISTLQLEPSLLSSLARQFQLRRLLLTPIFSGNHLGHHGLPLHCNQACLH